MHYAAFEIGPKEQPHKAVELLMRTVEVQKGRLRRLDLLGYLRLGSRRFLRFRSEDVDIVRAARSLGRAFVVFEGSSYVVRASDETLLGPVNSVAMLCIGEPGVKRVYRGPSIKLWERQFLET